MPSVFHPPDATLSSLLFSFRELPRLFLLLMYYQIEEGRRGVDARRDQEEYLVRLVL